MHLASFRGIGDRDPNRVVDLVNFRKRFSKNLIRFQSFSEGICRMTFYMHLASFGEIGDRDANRAMNLANFCKRFS